MAAKIFKINYKSDFILTLNSDAGWMTPFCIKFWTGAPSLAFFAQWDGETYTHCSYDPSEPTKLTVQFDDHCLPIGNLKYQVAYHFTVADFPNDTEDEVINSADITTEIDNETYQVMLDFTGETAPEIQFSLPAYANETQRIDNEQTRQRNEQARVDAEGGRVSAESGRVIAEFGRVNAERDRVEAEEARQSAYIANEGTKVGSGAGDGSRWGEYKQAEINRNTEYQSAEDTRNTSCLTAEGSKVGSVAGDGSRWGEYKQAETERNGSYAAEEGSQASSVAGDGSRWGAYKQESSIRSSETGFLDVSKYNSVGGVPATYSDLSTALAAIPQIYQAGGMSIKFIQSSDNKYVQYRLMSTSWSTNVRNWQGVDEEPTVGSRNLAESGGVQRAIGLNPQTFTEIDFSSISPIGFYADTTNLKWKVYSTYQSKIIPIPQGAKYIKISGTQTTLYFLLADGTPPTSHGEDAKIALEPGVPYAGTTVVGDNYLKVPSNCTHIGVLVYRTSEVVFSLSYTTDDNVVTAIDAHQSETFVRTLQVHSRLDGWRIYSNGNASRDSNYELVRYYMGHLNRNVQKLYIKDNFDGLSAVDVSSFYFGNTQTAKSIIVPYIKFGGKKTTIANIPTNAAWVIVSKLKTTSDAELEIVTDDSKVIFEDKPSLIPVVPFSTTENFLINGNGWIDSNSDYNLIRFYIKDIEYVKIKASVTKKSIFAFSTSASASGTIASTVEVAGADGIYKIPDEGQYLLISYLKTDEVPSVFRINGYYQPQSTTVPMLCAKLRWDKGVVVACQGRYVFAPKFSKGVCKIDFGIESSPVVVGEAIANHATKNDFRAVGMAITGNYLYIATRNNGSGDAQAGNTQYGGFLDIVDIENWEVVNTISYSTDKVTGYNYNFGKATNVAVYGNYLALAQNLGGWRLYDITDRENPVQLSYVDTRQLYVDYKTSIDRNYGAVEYQSCQFYLDSNNNLRLLLTGYGDNIVEIYDPTSPITSRDDALCIVSFKDDDIKNYISVKSHTRMGKVRYPYVYSTLGAWPDSVDNVDRKIGVIVTDISDLANPVNKFALVPSKDMGNDFGIEGSPLSVEFTEKYLIVNNYTKGFAYFDISNPAKPKYLGLFGDTHAGDVIYTDDGRLICGCSGKSTDTEVPLTIWRGLN